MVSGVGKKTGRISYFGSIGFEHAKVLSYQFERAYSGVSGVIPVVRLQLKPSNDPVRIALQTPRAGI